MRRRNRAWRGSSARHGKVRLTKMKKNMTLRIKTMAKTKMKKPTQVMMNKIKSTRQSSKPKRRWRRKRPRRERSRKIYMRLRVRKMMKTKWLKVPS